MKARSHFNFQNRILMLVIVAAAPAWLVSALFIRSWDVSATSRWCLFLLITALVLGGAYAVKGRIMLPLQSLANLLEALREGDYSLRGRNVDPNDVVGEVMIEVNSLSRMLYEQRLEALETGVLLEKVIAEVDIAVFAFDPGDCVLLVNRAAETLLGRSGAELIGRTAAEVGLAKMLDTSSGAIVTQVFPGGAGRWEVRRRIFRQGGRPHELLVISDLSRALREEERQAWRRLVRVIGHELNGSLAPIKSMAGTLRKLIEREPPPEDWRDDAHAGLAIIYNRSESLSRFIGAYARLAQLPPPTRQMVRFGELVRRVASLHGDCVTVESGPDLELAVDPDQIEQVLINLVKNAVEAIAATDVTSMSGRCGVRVRWRCSTGYVVAEVEDDGDGLAPTENLWVPFFTTKPAGTGIGLVLAREIVENHGGEISLENRKGGRGCVARVSLPLGGVVGATVSAWTAI